MKIVSVASLGLCEHCGVALSMQDMPQECFDVEWFCPACRQKITNENFGYTRDGKKIKWVGPEKQWISKEPKKRFRLGDFDVLPADEFRQTMISLFLR